MTYFTLLLVLVVAIAGSWARGLNSQALDDGDSHNRVLATVNLKLTNENSFKGHVKFDNQHHEVHLQKAERVLTPEFKVFITSQDASGRIVSTPTSFTREEIMAMEDDVYVDRYSKAAFSVQHKDGNDVQLHGVLNGVHVTRDGDDSHVAFVPKTGRPLDRSFQDYDIPSTAPLTYSNGYSPDMKGVTVAEVEIFPTVDMSLFNLLGKSAGNVTKYLTIMCHDINNRYDGMADPSVTFKVVGFNAVANDGSQPYLTNADFGGRKFDMDKVLDLYRDWMNANNAGFPAYDSSPLLSTENFAYTDEDGTIKVGVAGIASLRGACGEYRYSVNKDKNAYWAGVDTIIHECAHNIGAPHDGKDPSTESCPWEDGNIMSYERWGEKVKFYFSECSKRTIKAFINSNEGACLRSLQSKPWPAGNQNAGDVLTLDQQCKVEWSDPEAYFDFNNEPAMLCRKLICVSKGYYKPIGNMPADNSPCDPKDSSKKCWMGDCVSR